MEHTPYQFAGFTFPRSIDSRKLAPLSKRLASWKASHKLHPVTGDYQTAPSPILDRKTARETAFFYYGSDFAPSLRWEYADEMEDAPRFVRDVRGYYMDGFQSETVRAIVGRLPKSRGFVAGWTMGESMASEMDTTIYDDAREACIAANSLAESAGERFREDDAKFQAEQQTETERETIAANRIEMRRIIAELRCMEIGGPRGIDGRFPALKAAVCSKLSSLKDESRKAYERIQALADNYWLAVE